MRKYIALLLLLSSGSALADDDRLDVFGLKRPKDLAVPPEEEAFVPPSMAGQHEWVIYPSTKTTERLKIEIAVDTLSYGKKDGILRFAVGVTPKEGNLRNVLYEGFDCQFYQSRTYAAGNPDGSWLMMNSTKWTVADRNKRNDWHGEMLFDFCRDSLPYNITDLQRSLRAHESPKLTDPQHFTEDGNGNN